MHKLFLFTALLFLCSFDRPSETDLVSKAAQQDLAHYLKLIPEGRESLYGFPSRGDMVNCTTGTPYQMLSLDMSFYKEPYNANKDYLSVINEWRVPVVSNGNYLTLLTVDKNGDNYSVVDLGGAGISKELQKLSGNKTGSDHHFYLFRIYQLAADFFVDATTSVTEASFTPLPSAVAAMPSLENKTYHIREILPVIKSAIDQKAKN